ncbi:hypothetical protein [Thalassotalea sp. ND16A]|uniref:hypothetical protein n=1 Tax=Thalassotalea sp. ND16A TaxID=1535422 RepID=UPI00051D1F0C|nr:hypothetical protein [Thalassotalea sp. ND16A]KGJ95697.1 hypothetical protein ND16A_1232 [Thalassotalea sp. ND16A]
MNRHLIKRTIVTLLCTMAIGLSFNSSAEPYLAYKTNLKCMACHVNPNGGGLRNEFGRNYGQSLLPAKTIDYDSKAIAQLSQLFTLGADARFNAIGQNDDDDNTEKTFELSNAQLYLNIAIPNSGLSFYLDQQVAPGTAINREAYAMYQFDQRYYIKAGTFFVPYGMRIEDDSAFIRQATGMNFDNSDNGVEFSIDYTNTTVNFYISNGTSQASNDDDAFLYGMRVEHLFSKFRAGASFALNDGDQQTTMVNLYSGLQWRDFTFLAEADLINLEQANTVNGEDIEQLASLLEVNYQWRQGVNIKLTAEYFDPDRDVSENQQTRYSVVAEYTPISHLQLRFGLRKKEDIPQLPEQNYDLVFIQSHFYF